jgi:hypothetical protein
LIYLLICLILALAPNREIGQLTPRPDCRPSSSSYWKERTIKDGKSRWRVQLGPCISDDLARQILRAIRDKTLVDRQPLPAGTVAPSKGIPVLSDKEVNSIDIGKRDAAWPVHQYEVETVDRRGNGFHGLVLFLNIRDGQVELVGSAGWVA